MQVIIIDDYWQQFAYSFPKINLTSANIENIAFSARNPFTPTWEVRLEKELMLAWARRLCLISSGITSLQNFLLPNPTLCYVLSVCIVPNVGVKGRERGHCS